jgi:exo-poly-alpha-galacturonosidase
MKKQILCIVALLIWFSSVAFPKADQNSPSSEPKASTTNAAKDSSIAPPGKLMVPPLALDDTSITVIWEKPADYSNVVSYKVYQNGSLAGTTKNLFYTIAGLEPNSPYSITVKSVDASGNESQPGNKVVQSTAPAMKVFDVTKYGAIGDGNTLNTKAIQKAIDECTAGGKVLVPAGTFLSGALFLKSDMTIQIDGTLMGSDDINEYPMTNLRFPYYLSGKGYMGLINAYTEKYGSLTNIKICGKGNMCGGNGTAAKIPSSALRRQP